MAFNAAFSRGSPTSSPSSRVREWQEARIHCVSKGDSFTGVRLCRELGAGGRWESDELGLQEMKPALSQFSPVT